MVMNALNLESNGYTYIIMDDCWSTKTRNANGWLLPDKDMFPSESLKDLSDFVHQRDIPLKLGIKQSSGA